MSIAQASSEAPAAAPVQTSSTRRVLAASLAGTAIEYYDFFIYSTAASLVLGPLFFPAASPTAQLFSAYASFAVAFLARPVGAALFGHFGDRIGRKSTLVAALLTMGVSTVLIGLLPGYAHLGWLAPALLCILRFGQGLGLGGEWGGAALLAVENAPPGWRGRFGIFPQLGIPVGLIAANGVFLVMGLQLTPDQFRAWGWRAPFVLSALLVALGLWVRLKLTETPAFKAALAKGPPPGAPLGELVRRHFPPLLAGGVAVIGVFAIFYLATAFTLGYGVSVLGYDRQALLGVQLGAFVLMGLGMLIAGWWCDKASPRVVMMAGYVALFVTGQLLPRLMIEGSLLRFGGFMALSLFLMGFISGPLGALLPSLFPTRVRYTGSSIAFTAGGILGGGIAPMAATVLAAEGGLLPVSLYFSGAALLSFLALLLLGRAQVRDPAGDLD
jgi:MFS family permease